jgi:hypothetical protein
MRPSVIASIAARSAVRLSREPDPKNPELMAVPHSTQARLVSRGHEGRYPHTCYWIGTFAGRFRRKRPRNHSMRMAGLPVLHETGTALCGF